MGGTKALRWKECGDCRTQNIPMGFQVGKQGEQWHKVVLDSRKLLDLAQS